MKMFTFSHPQSSNIAINNAVGTIKLKHAIPITMKILFQRPKHSPNIPQYQILQNHKHSLDGQLYPADCEPINSDHIPHNNNIISITYPKFSYN